MEWANEELGKAYEIKTQRLGLGAGLQEKGNVLDQILYATDGNPK